MSHYLRMETTEPTPGIYQLAHTAMATDFAILVG